jgi:nitrite reductase/ring-hydroxylating ferredoxin subunit
MVAVACEDELDVNQMKLVRVNGERVEVARTESGWTAFDDRCTHKRGSLAGGVMACNTVTCPWHGSQFDVATGAVKSGPAEQPVRTYELEVAGGEVRLKVPAERALTAG